VSQSRRASALEAIVNVLIGYWVAIAAQAVIFPLFGFHASTGQHLAIGGLFTVVSLLRSYLLRRAFNAITRRASAINGTTP
jgi:CO/xanthine dehydrogenase FAD-binding subunit